MCCVVSFFVVGHVFAVGWGIIVLCFYILYFAFCDHYILFCPFFCRDAFLVTVLWKYDKIKNFWLFYAVRRMNQPEISCPSWKNSNWSTKVVSRSLQWYDRMSITRLFKWHRRFKEGREEVEDDHRSGRPSTSRTDENVECARQKVRSDPRLIVRMIADELRRVARNLQWGGCLGGLGAVPPALENFAFFCKNNFILGLFWLKKMILKRGLEIDSVQTWLNW